MKVLVEMSEEQVGALGAVTGMLVDVDRTISQLLAVKDGLLALGSRLAVEIGEDAVAAICAGDATGVHSTGASSTNMSAASSAVAGSASAMDTSATDASTTAASATGASAKDSALPGSAAAEAVELAGRAVAAELAAALRVSDRTVQHRMGEAAAVVSEFPQVWRAQGAGRISAAHTRAIIDAGAYLDDQGSRAVYAEQMIGFAETTSPNRVSRMGRRVAERFQPRPLDARHRDARQRRRVWASDRPDGMAMLGIFGPAALIHGAHDRLTALGLTLLTNPDRPAGDTRCLDEVRCDLALDLLLSGTPAGHDPDGLLADIRGTVTITVPAATLSGTGATPAELNGRTTIDAATARRLAAAASGWDRVLTHPTTGAVTAVDRYRPSADLKRWLLARDQRCRFPGCGHPARECDIDHTKDAATGGPTWADNLGNLCRRHHVAKHQTPWTVEQLHEGTFAWTSPTGRVYLDHPPPPNTVVADDSTPPF
ncbi:DUF222 domain-containing protein [Microbacterium sp. ZW T6_19]|uniref:HNH endonuclease signature motif containing protein n=1 Tax=Microbacterium sp. ZW T6_19 TaxID=3378082 RepID=UPI003852F3BF